MLAFNRLVFLVAQAARGQWRADACCGWVTLLHILPWRWGIDWKIFGNTRPSGLRRFLPNFNKKAMVANQPVIERLHQIGERYSKTPAQVALRWLIENPLVLPIAGAKNSKQALENAGALTFSLAAEEIEALDQATLAWRT
jgi:hypothetical protein